jgi:NADH:ubiquinone oxidoreductase subunit 6 (subunit J)
MGEQIAFGLTAAGVVGCALLVVLLKNAFQAAVALIGTLVAVSVLFVLERAPFVALVQVIVYAGAIVTLFLFVLAYLGEQALADEDRLERFEVFSWITILVITAMGAIVMFTTALPAFHDVPETTDDIGSPRAVGFAFLREHLLPFEATSLVLLVGAVGAVVLAKRAVLAEGGR